MQQSPWGLRGTELFGCRVRITTGTRCNRVWGCTWVTFLQTLERWRLGASGSSTGELAEEQQHDPMLLLNYMLHELWCQTETGADGLDLPEPTAWELNQKQSMRECNAELEEEVGGLLQKHESVGHGNPQQPAEGT